MWATAFLGASSAFIESTLGQIYKREEKGQYRGGPAFYIYKMLDLHGIGPFLRVYKFDLTLIQ